MKYFKIKVFKKFHSFDEFSTVKNDFENQNFEIFDKIVYNFGKSDNYMI